MSAQRRPADPLARIRSRVLGAVMAALALAGIGSTLLIAHAQYAVLPRVLAAKAQSVGEIFNRDLVHAVELGFPLGALRGVNSQLDELRHDHPELGYMLVLDAAGTRLAASGAAPALEVLQGRAKAQADAASTLALPIRLADGRVIGTTWLGIDDAYVQRLVSDRIFDLVTALVVTGIIALELLMLLLDFGMIGPMRALAEWAAALAGGAARASYARFGFREFVALVRDAGAASGPAPGAAPPVLPWPLMIRYIRFALFLFVLGDTLCMPFLPLFSAEVTEPMFGLSSKALVGLPITSYVLTSTLVQFAGVAVLERLQHRTVFLIAAVFSLAGFAYAAVTHDLPGLILARAASGVGLGLVFMVCQAAILTHVPSSSRTLGIATFTGTFFLANFCGAAFGGLAAQQIGFRACFALAGVITLLAAIFAYASFGASRQAPVAASAAQESGSGYGRVLRNRRFAALLLFCAVPNRAFNVALLMYLAPLYLASLGATKTEIGRTLAVYGLAMAFLAPLLAPHIDRWRLHWRSVVLGSLLCAGGGAAVLLSPGHGVLILVGLMGVGQALSVPSQMSLVPQVTGAEIRAFGMPRVMSIFRAGERMPSFIAPLLAQLLVGGVGYRSAMVGFCLWLGASAILLGATQRGGAAAPATVEA